MTEQTKCPVCGKRLFDIDQYLIGKMKIKCPQCKKIIKLSFVPESIVGTVEPEGVEPSKTGVVRTT